MSDNVRRDNRRALPKYLLTVATRGMAGRVLGFFTGVASLSYAHHTLLTICRV